MRGRPKRALTFGVSFARTSGSVVTSLLIAIPFNLHFSSKRVNCVGNGSHRGPVFWQAGPRSPSSIASAHHGPQLRKSCRRLGRALVDDVGFGVCHVCNMYLDCALLRVQQPRAGIVRLPAGGGVGDDDHQIRLRVSHNVLLDSSSNAVSAAQMAHLADKKKPGGLGPAWHES